MELSIQEFDIRAYEERLPWRGWPKMAKVIGILTVVPNVFVGLFFLGLSKEWRLELAMHRLLLKIARNEQSEAKVPMELDFQEMELLEAYRKEARVWKGWSKLLRGTAYLFIVSIVGSPFGFLLLWCARDEERDEAMHRLILKLVERAKQSN